MKLLMSFKKWIFALTVVIAPFAGVSADDDASERLHQRAREGVFDKDFLSSGTVSSDLNSVSKKNIKTEIMKHLFIQDTYLSYLAQLDNNGLNGLALTSRLNQLNEILLAILANIDDLTIFLTTAVNPVYANDFNVVMSNEASLFLYYNQCVLGIAPPPLPFTSCDDVSQFWANTIPAMYATLLSMGKPGLYPVIEGYALERYLAQINESGINGFGKSPPTLDIGFNSLQIYLPQSIASAAAMVKNGAVP